MSWADRHVPLEMRVDPSLPPSAVYLGEAPPLGPKLSDESLALLALTADYPAEHPLRQAAARLSARLALAEGKIATATAVLERAAVSSELSVIGLRTDQALEILKR